MTYTKFLVGFDIHGDQQDTGANRVFFDFADYWKPTIRVCGGDLFDLRPLRKGADADERRESMREDINAGKRWFNKFSPTHYLMGNHCARLWELAENGKGVEGDYAQEKSQELEEMFKFHKTTVFPYNKRTGILRLGHLKVLHGFAGGVSAARTHAMAYGGCLFGHVHYIDEHSIAGLDRRVARACGCLCKLDMAYNSRQIGTLKQAHGFAYGLLNEKTGDYHVYQAEEVNGKWFLPTEFKSF